MAEGLVQSSASLSVSTVPHMTQKDKHESQPLCFPYKKSRGQSQGKKSLWCSMWCIETDHLLHCGSDLTGILWADICKICYFCTSFRLKVWWLRIWFIQCSENCSDTTQRECVQSVRAAQECAAWKLCCVSTCSFDSCSQHRKTESFFYQSSGSYFIPSANCEMWMKVLN